MKLLIGMAAAAALFASPAFADSLVLATDAGTLQNTTGFTGFFTHGSEMDGMTVKVFFADGSTDTQIWTDTGIVSGAATGSGWSLSMQGDTFGGSAFGFDDWVLTNTNDNSAKAIKQVLIDGKPGKTVFDRTDPSPGTTGSASGLDFFEDDTFTGLSILVTYRDLVAVTPDPAVGDVYRFLDIQFTNTGFFGFNQTGMRFVQDTDNIITDLTSVPEPTTLALLAFGMGGAALRRRRNKNRATA